MRDGRRKCAEGMLDFLPGGNGVTVAGTREVGLGVFTWGEKSWGIPGGTGLCDEHMDPT